MKLDDGLFFLQTELAPLDVWPQATHASSHGHAPQCRQAASDPPLASMDLSSGRSSHSTSAASIAVVTEDGLKEAERKNLPEVSRL
ncbi:hypothetical protein EJB05_48940, partial [Eragrostis curvula]